MWLELLRTYANSVLERFEDTLVGKQTMRSRFLQVEGLAKQTFQNVPRPPKEPEDSGRPDELALQVPETRRNKPPWDRSRGSSPQLWKIHCILQLLLARYVAQPHSDSYQLRAILCQLNSYLILLAVTCLYVTSTRTRGSVSGTDARYFLKCNLSAIKYIYSEASWWGASTRTHPNLFSCDCCIDFVISVKARW